MKDSELPPNRATVVITTKNRKDELRRAVASALSQRPVPEVIVIDDGSTDGTSDMVCSEFPRAKLHRFDQSRGLIVRRNEGVRLASGDIIVSIDDDAEFTSPRVIDQTLQEFDDPRVAAVTIPYVDVKISPDILQQPPALGVWVTSAYVGTSHALRKDVFAALGGYRELLLHMTEERDYCLRLLSAGFVVKMGKADLIHHYQSPVRKSNWNRMMERRNDLIFAICNVPFPQLLLHFTGTILSGLLYGARNKCLGATLAGYARFRHVLHAAWKSRCPVSKEAYFLMRYLQDRGVCKLQDIEGRLAPLGVRSQHPQTAAAAETKSRASHSADN